MLFEVMLKVIEVSTVVPQKIIKKNLITHL